MTMEFFQNHIKIRNAFCLFIACLFYALALNLFFAGNNIAAGGLAGIATVLSGVFHVKISVLILLMNIPLLVLGFFLKGWRFTRNTIIGFGIYIILVEITSYLPTLTVNPLLAALFGGALYGIGMRFMTVADGSIGGTELIVRVLFKFFPKAGIGKLCLLVDGTAVIISFIVFHNVELCLYAILALFICSRFSDKVLFAANAPEKCIDNK